MEIMNLHEAKKCKIKKVLMGNRLVNPLLINVDNRGLTEEELNQGECLWYEDEADKHVRIISLNNGYCNYQGTTKTKGNVSKTLLVLQNKKTNKVQLLEVGECKLERALEKPSLQTNYENDKMQTTYEDNKSKLLKAFGSKKSNRASEIGSRMRINAEMMSSQIKHTTADVEVDIKELELADSTEDTCLPPCHRDATNVAGVYQLEDFLTQKEMNSMEDEAFTIMNLLPFTEEESGYSKFFIDSLERLQNKVSLERIKILLYVESLIRFFNLPLHKLKKKELVLKISPFSGLITKKIMENFTIDTVNGRVRNPVMEDKIVIHLVVLTVLACDFSCNTEELSKYLPRFGIKKIVQIARSLSLSTRDKVTWFLKLPLPPQRSMFFRRRT